MRSYETIIILKPELGESEVKEEMKKLSTVLEASKVSSLRPDIWGKREIAYKLHGIKHGTFVSLTYQSSDHTVVAKLNDQLRINDRVIKYQTLRADEKRRAIKAPFRKKDDAILSGIEDESFR